MTELTGNEKLVLLTLKRLDGLVTVNDLWYEAVMSPRLRNTLSVYQVRKIVHKWVKLGKIVNQKYGKSNYYKANF